MLTVCWRPLADIHGNIQHSTLYTSHQLALGKRRSQEMQTTHQTLTTHALIVLAELHLVAHQWLHFLLKLTLAEAFKEIATSISKQARLNDEHALNITLYYVHINIYFILLLNPSFPKETLHLRYNPPPCFIRTSKAKSFFILMIRIPQAN